MTYSPASYRAAHEDLREGRAAYDRANAMGKLNPDGTRTMNAHGGNEQAREAENFKRIWLSPLCYAEAGEERSWCQDNQGPCDDCGDPSVEYVRADLAKAERDDLVKALENLLGGMRGYLRARNMLGDETPFPEFKQADEALAKATP